MSKAAMPYHLRQNKFADRRLFVDLLRYLVPAKMARDFLYIGMGGASLEDHKLINQELGICKLISFDKDEWNFRRQLFNRPVDSVHILNVSSKECIDSFWSTLESLGYQQDTPVVVWLDFTSVTEVYSQIQEITALASILNTGDVLRVTLNAHPPSYYKSPEFPKGERRFTAEQIRSNRLSAVEERLSDAMPYGVTASDMDEVGLPRVLANTVELAILKGLAGSPGLQFLPLNLVRYADGQQMLSITGCMIASGSSEAFLNETGLNQWEFFPHHGRKFTIYQLAS